MSDRLILRPYQVDGIEALRRSYAGGHRAPLFVLPTAAGKTVVFAEIIAGANRKQRRTLVAVHRRELIRQASEKLTWAGTSHGIIAAGFGPSPDAQVQVGSIQTLARRLPKLPLFDLIVFDEAHHCRADSWSALITAQPQAKLLGVTATPARLDGKGLGIKAGGSFDDLVLGPSTAELIAAGYLARVRCFAPAHRIDLRSVRVVAGDYVREDAAGVVNTSTITGDALQQYRRRADHAPAIAFCVNVQHAEAVADAFRDAGYRAACVHGGTPTIERDALIGGLGSPGGVELLTSCDLISEGLDVPAVGAVIMLRPTKSLVLHRQQIGRGMRPAEGKSVLIVLDHVGNCITHGLPETEPAWSLAGVDKTPREPPTWECPNCGMLNPVSRRECEECGFVRPIPPRLARSLPSARDGELDELTAAHLARVGRMPWREFSSVNRSKVELQAYAKAHGYHPGWVRHRLREQEEAA